MGFDVYDTSDSPTPDDAGTAAQPRPYICVLFECCDVYARIYRQVGQPYYSGRCPKCLRELHVRVGQEGTSCRFFRAQ